MRVTYLQLAKPKEVLELSKKMSIQEFCNRRHQDFNARIRVNGKVVSADYQLKNNDIVMTVTKSPGGVV